MLVQHIDVVLLVLVHGFHTRGRGLAFQQDPIIGTVGNINHHFQKAVLWPNLGS